MVLFFIILISALTLLSDAVTLTILLWVDAYLHCEYSCVGRLLYSDGHSFWGGNHLHFICSEPQPKVIVSVLIYTNF